MTGRKRSGPHVLRMRVRNVPQRVDVEFGIAYDCGHVERWHLAKPKTLLAFTVRMLDLMTDPANKLGSVAIRVKLAQESAS